MTTRTTTGVSHYHVQKARRAKFIEDWRANHRDVVAVEDVVMHKTERGHRVGVYVGEDGERPTRTMDALAHEFDPGATTTIHRHSWDAMVLVVAGWGWTEIDGERIDWGPGDSLHIPAWAWHRSGNDGTEVARYLTFSSEPMLATMGMNVLEDAGHTPVAELPGRPAFSTHLDGDDPYARRIRRVGREQTNRRAGRLHTSWDDLELVNTPRGTRTTFLLDRAIGYQASGITMAMFEIGPGRGQSMHRHPGEAWLYVLDGEGRTYLGTEPEGGTTHRWKKGDVIVVDHFLWHQHFNDHPENTAKVVRIHMFDSLLETMRALCDPLVLFEEPPNVIRDKQAGDPTTIEWPALERPTWP
ncbi:cupin domain-containing protein [Kibdelosporangium philippinense]|uniref:Cupin domain-containing protein n=1 Tax=Kibdelosporangium philippinense TaxID=211113 RepID=A0ABS8ZHM1_9PSEU|nr:cupin domain-containing protein [Kibdelosporangium philippinense]MCE7006997.1 cupin domain-containing protein [Kibdelosporangium philippinense]